MTNKTPTEKKVTTTKADSKTATKTAAKTSTKTTQKKPVVKAHVKTTATKAPVDANSKLTDLIKEISNNKTEGIVTYENGKSYTRVDYRIKKAREVFGFDLRILNTVIHRDEREAIVQCNVYLKENGNWELVQNAHAHEFRDTSPMNLYNYVEIAETSAMGRALGGLGLFGNEFASSNEMSSSLNHQENKTETKTGSKNSRNVVSSKQTKKIIVKIKPDQIAFIQDYVNKTSGITTEDILDGKGVSTVESLTEGQATEIIGYLKSSFDTPL
jgi:hypothetical protein